MVAHCSRIDELQQFDINKRSKGLMTIDSRDISRNYKEVPPLKSIYFYLTEGCNLACRHCWIGPKFRSEGEDPGALPVELIEKAIQEAKPLGLTGVKFSGGEPLLHPNFKSLLKTIIRENLSLTIETNGTLCTPELSAEIAKVPRRIVAVSIDGKDAGTHEWIRCIPGSFEKAIK